MAAVGEAEVITRSDSTDKNLVDGKDEVSAERSFGHRAAHS
jgi:hypothetical protein